MKFIEMKNVVVLVIVLLFSFCLQAREYGKFYYAFEDKIEIVNVPNKITIKVDTNTNMADYEMFLKSTLENIKIEWQREDICKIEFKTESEITKENITKVILSNDRTLHIGSVSRLKDGGEFGFVDEVVIKFFDNIDNAKKDEMLDKFNLQRVRSTEVYELCIIKKGFDVLEVANNLFETGMFEFAYPNIIDNAEPSAYYPNDTYFQNQVALHNVGQAFTDGHTGTNDADIDAPEAWDITKGSSDIVIAVFDMGITPNHPDLPSSRQVIFPGSNFGYGSSDDPSTNCSYPMTPAYCAHGNACAGIIAATMDNEEGISGIAPECKIMPIRWDGLTTSTAPKGGFADGIVFAAAHGADIISNSWGYGDTIRPPNYIPAIVAAIQYAINKGSVVIFSAGNTADHSYNNDGYVTFPANANVPELIIVGASDRYDMQSNYSPTSSLVDVVAPSHKANWNINANREDGEMWTIDVPGYSGINPYPLRPPYGYLPDTGPNYLDYTGRFGGTSFSCAVVAGVAALVLSVSPDLTPIQVHDIICNTADKVGGYTYTNGKSDNIGAGRVNAYKALIHTINNSCSFISITGTQITRKVYCRNITLENATIPSGVTLELVATESITIGPNVTVQSGGKLELKSEGSVSYNSNFTVETGASFINY